MRLPVHAVQHIGIKRFRGIAGKFSLKGNLRGGIKNIKRVPGQQKGKRIGRMSPEKRIAVLHFKRLGKTAHAVSIKAVPRKKAVAFRRGNHAACYSARVQNAYMHVLAFVAGKILRQYGIKRGVIQPVIGIGHAFHAKAANELAVSDLASQEAEVTQASLSLSYTKIYAPQDGKVTKKSIEPGAFVSVGQGLLALVPDKTWVTANFKETQLKYMRPAKAVFLLSPQNTAGRIFCGADNNQSKQNPAIIFAFV